VKFNPAWTAEPLGDQAILLSCRDEATAQQIAAALREQAWEGVTDVVLAYHSVALHLDPSVRTVSQVLPLFNRLKLGKTKSEPRLHMIPCCYEMGEDLEAAASHLKLSVDRVITLHTQSTFTVFAIGFSPGFPYLGWIPKPLQGIPRRAEPRKRVPAGSVAIVGKQSCIYPQPTPGGWALIGRTPLELVNLKDGYFPLQAGDRVQFERVDESEYQRLIGNRLNATMAD
jgi:inhibitor of KinA